MKLPLLVTAAVAIASIVGGPTQARQHQTRSPAMTYSNPLNTNRINGLDRMNQLTGDAHRQQLTRRAGTAAQRAERADRLVALVNAGQCGTAYQTAIDENDREMAQRIREVCLAETHVSAPSPAAPED